MLGGLIAACHSAGTLPASLETPADRQAPSDWQVQTFGPLALLAGRTFTGTPSDPESEQQRDVQTWRWTVGGSVLSVLHALEDGSYGGETLIYHDNKDETLAYAYITNAGFMTRGTLLLEGERSWTAEEEVTGHPTITRVRSSASFEADGTIITASSYLQNDEWVPGHGFVYLETSQVSPVFTPPELN